MKFVRYALALLLFAGCAFASSTAITTGQLPNNATTMTWLASQSAQVAALPNYLLMYVQGVGTFQWMPSATQAQYPCAPPVGGVGTIGAGNLYVCSNDATPTATGRWVYVSTTATVPDFASLLTMTSAQLAKFGVVTVAKYRAGFPQGGGDFVWLSSPAASGLVPDNLGLVVAPSDHPATCSYGCAVRKLDGGALYSAMFGAPNNGLDDDQPTLNAMVTAGFNYGLRAQGADPGLLPSITSYNFCTPGGTIRLNNPLVIDPRNTTAGGTARSNALSVNFDTGGCPIFVIGTGGIYFNPTSYGTNSSDLKSATLYGHNSIVYGNDVAAYGLAAESNFGFTAQDFHFENFLNGIAVKNIIGGAAGDNRYSERNRFLNMFARKIKGCYANEEPAGADISFDDTEIDWFKCDISEGPDAASTIAFNLHGYQGRSIYSGLSVWKRNDDTSLQKAFYLDGNFETVTGISWAVDGGSGKLHDIEFGPAYSCTSADCDTSNNLTLTVAPSWTRGEGKLALPDGWESKLNIMVKQTNMGKLVNQNLTGNALSPTGRTRMSSDAGYMTQTFMTYFANGTSGTAQTQTFTLYGTQKVYNSSCGIYPNSTDPTVLADAGSSFCGVVNFTINGDDTVTAQVYRIPGPSGRGTTVFYKFITDRN